MTLALPHMAPASRQGPFQLPSLGFNKTRECAGHGFFTIPRSLTAGTSKDCALSSPKSGPWTTSFPARTTSSRRSSCSAQQLIGHSARNTVARCAGWRRSAPVHRSPAAAALTSAPPGPSSGPSNNSAQTGGDQPGMKCTQEMPGACALPRQEDFLAIPQTSHRRPKESKSKATKIPKRHWPDWNFFGSSEERACSSRPLAQDDAGFPVSTSLCACARRPIFHIPHHHPDTLTHSLVDVPALAALAASAGFPQSFRGVSTGLPSACIPVLPTGIAWPSVSISCTVGSQLKHSMGSNGPASQPPAPEPFPMRQGASAGVPSQDHDGCHLGRNRCSSLRAKARCCGRPSPPTPGQITWLLFLTDLHA